jgi:hypothetical protein
MAILAGVGWAGMRMLGAGGVLEQHSKALTANAEAVKQGDEDQRAEVTATMNPSEQDHGGADITAAQGAAVLAAPSASIARSSTSRGRSTFSGSVGRPAVAVFSYVRFHGLGICDTI